ncbi:hypothetical protein E6C27_scaffold133G00430 [Cucumis melo var. makuwa]|uniref:Uncharacterized protein n=1 Tax=Cucumis melo var. makuwa TaxID=1194695 RepID=A0A5A7U2Y4_CUCMM|nr:hypothetical protein E6C27_scaffold133G00430 [Cucumis melo var. makuwa]
MDEELACLDWVLNIPSNVGYKDNPAAPLREDDDPPSRPHGQYELHFSPILTLNCLFLRM